MSIHLNNLSIADLEKFEKGYIKNDKRLQLEEKKRKKILLI